VNLDVGFVEESSVTDVTVVHHLLPLITLTRRASSASTSAAGPEETRSWLGWLWFVSPERLQPKSAVVDQGAHGGVGHLLVAVVLLLHHGAVKLLLLDDGVVRVLVSSQSAAEDGGEDGGEGVPLLEAGGARHLAGRVGLAQQVGEGGGQGVQVGLGARHAGVADAVGGLRDGGGHDGTTGDLVPILLIVLLDVAGSVLYPGVKIQVILKSRDG